MEGRISPDSTSYPFLAVAQAYGVSYRTVLALADAMVSVLDEHERDPSSVTPERVHEASLGIVDSIPIEDVLTMASIDSYRGLGKAVTEAVMNERARRSLATLGA